MNKLELIGRFGLFLVGLFCLGYAGFESYEGFFSTKWPSVQARIERATIKESTDKFGQRHYEPSIMYSYSVNGKTYRGERIQFGGTTTSTTEEGILEPYKKAITVAYYNPNKPDVACLKPGVNWLSFAVMAGIGVLCLWPRKSSYGYKSGGYEQMRDRFSRSGKSNSPATEKSSVSFSWIIFVGLLFLIAYLIASAPIFSQVQGLPHSLLMVALIFLTGLSMVLSWSALPVLAVCCLRSGRLEYAERIGRLSARLLKQLGPDSLETARAFALLSEIKRERSHYQDALTFAQEALEIIRRRSEFSTLLSSGAANEELLKISNSLEEDNITEPLCREAYALILCDFGRYEDACREATEAISQLRAISKQIENKLPNCRQAAGPTSPSTPGVTLQLADSLTNNKQQLTSRLKLTKRVTVSCLSALGRFNLENGSIESIEKAEEALKEALREWQSLAANEPWQEAEILSSLAETYFQSNRPEESKQAIANAHKLIASTHNRESELARANLLVCEARLLAGADNRSAYTKLENALALRRRWLGENNLAIAKVFICMGKLQQSEGKTKQSIECFRTAQTMISSIGERNHPLLAELPV
jgi:tetratricopeptide (TPR) repeat protein